MIEDAQLSERRVWDEDLLAGLYAKNQASKGYVAKSGLGFANKAIATFAKATYSTSDLAALEGLLEQNGAVNIPLQAGSVRINGVVQPVTFVAATEIDADSPSHGDMSSMLYIRDHVQVSRVLMDLYLQDPQRYKAEGSLCRKLLISCLHLLSTPSQLARFDDVIRRGNDAGQEAWPHISLFFNDLEGLQPNGWRNKQDTFQMLADLTFDAIDKGFLHPDELTDSHKQFLGSIVPLLASVGWPAYESSGSWEEIVARRTSVMMVETAMLAKMKKMTKRADISGFLEGGYNRAVADLPVAHRSFAAMLDIMLDAGLHEIGRRLPNESPDYDKTSVKYRQADATLIYGLMYDIPQLLADAKVPIGPDAVAMSVRQIEDTILQQVETLRDPVTGGIFRYKGDSYQRENFHTNEVQAIIKAIKNQVKKQAAQSGGEIDLDKKQMLRDQWTPRGRSAAWTHPLGQLSAWAARRSMQASDPAIAGRYTSLSTSFLNRALSMITGEKQWNATRGDNGLYQIRPVTPYRLPECYVKYRYGDAILTVPSPHTPLNWSSAELKHAVGLLRISTARTNPQLAIGIK